MPSYFKNAANLYQPRPSGVTLLLFYHVRKYHGIFTAYLGGSDLFYKARVKTTVDTLRVVQNITTH